MSGDGRAVPVTAWLRDATGCGGRPAGRQVRLSERLRSLPLVAEAVLDGRVGREQAAALCRLVGPIGPAELRDAQTGLVEVASGRDPEFVKAWVRHLIATHWGVGLLARLSFHIYYGDPNTGLITAGWVLLWGAAALLLFRRTRRLTPLIVVHVLYDVHLSLLTTFGDGPDQVNIAVTMTLYFASILVWFVLFQQQRRGPECATPGPGPREGPRLRQRR